MIIDHDSCVSNPSFSSLRKRNKRRSKGHKQKQHRRSTIASFPIAGGRYAGRPVSEVPVSHLRYLLATRKASAADLWIIRQYLDDTGGPGK